MNHSYTLHKLFNHLLNRKDASKGNEIVKFVQMIYHHQDKEITPGAG